MSIASLMKIYRITGVLKSKMLIILQNFVFIYVLKRIQLADYFIQCKPHNTRHNVYLFICFRIGEEYVKKN